MEDNAMKSSLSRRFVLSGLAATSLAGAGCTTIGSDAQNFPQAFSSFAVDVGPLKEKGLGSFADLVGDATLYELKRIFADRVDPRGPRLVVRLTSLYMTAFPGGGNGDSWRWSSGGGGGSDSLEGDALAIDRKGTVIAQYHLLASRGADRGMVDPDEPGRAVALGQTYAQWLRRQLIR
ncbi:hypothetical protein [Microvirga flavescens]|uniref:hypothetical protein n=1 Tax=Microvirga flavescens TaxID=2249811 RepID=UPI000DD6452C|nr:hypothetical protein [Microvirga flavescens]